MRNFYSTPLKYLIIVFLIPVELAILMKHNINTSVIIIVVLFGSRSLEQVKSENACVTWIQIY